jgi:hypothetical protein
MKIWSLKGTDEFIHCKLGTMYSKAVLYFSYVLRKKIPLPGKIGRMKCTYGASGKCGLNNIICICAGSQKGQGKFYV